MNPNMAFGGGGGKSPLSRTDLRIVALVMGACLAVFLAFLGDQAVYKEAPKSHFQAIIAYVTVAGDYLSGGDRVTTFMLAVTFFFTTLAIIGFGVFWYLEIYIIEPLIMKRKLMYVKREKALINKYDDGTI